jgi:hypothetical protein
VLVSKDEKIVKEIIARYGATIDLKKSPYLIVEILRQFGARVGGPAQDCAPPGGPPKVHDPDEIMKQLKVKAAEVNTLYALLAKAIRARPSPRR